MLIQKGLFVNVFVSLQQLSLDEENRRNKAYL